MISPIIEPAAKIKDDQSVITICKNDVFPEGLKLSEIEEEYIKRCFADSEDLIVVNSYYRVVIIARESTTGTRSKKDESLRQLSVKVRDLLRQYKVKTVVITSDDSSEREVKVFAEGLIMALYHFTLHKKLSRKEKQQFIPEKILLHNIADPKWLEYFRDAIYFTRDLVNEPLSHLTAEIMSSRIKEFVASSGAKVEVFGARKIESLKMGGLLAVNRGSLDPPTFTVIEWKPDNCQNEKPVILIGKGVVFDTGGLNLKSTEWIEDMKSDMAGGAAVAAVMYLAARLELPLHIMAFIPATDNRPGVRAIAPGDIVRMYNGLNVEVLNTDAEGRLILADALSYADNFDPELVITIATLTGSAASTFGSQAIALMGNAEESFFDMVTTAGETVYERAARLPFWDEYGEMLKSDIADLKNIGGKEAGAITAGKFLENFTVSPFIHLDIAGTAILKKDEQYRLKGGTGAGVRILTEFLRIKAGQIEK